MTSHLALYRALDSLVSVLILSLAGTVTLGTLFI